MKQSVQSGMSDVINRIGDRRVVCSVSGGKDSAAASLYLTELGIEHDRIFADTGWEHPATYEYIRGPLTAKLGPIVEVRGERLFTDLVRHKRIFPDRTKRFCTDELKVKPIARWIAALDVDVVNVIGVRREESAARANVPEWEWSSKVDAEVWRPLFDWTARDVVEMHKRHGLPLNPLYAIGATRVGCWPCIHARQSEILLVADTDPARIDAIRELERTVNESATARALENGEELDWIRSMFSIRESKAREDEAGEVRRHHRPLPIDEAIAWARQGRGAQLNLLPVSCGEWGFCE